MSFLSGIVPWLSIVSPAVALGSAIFGRKPQIKVPDFPTPKDPLKGPVDPSMTASAAKARLAERSRTGRGVGGLVLSRASAPSSTPVSRTTLLGS